MTPLPDRDDVTSLLREAGAAKRAEGERIQQELARRLTMPLSELLRERTEKGA